MQWRSRRDGCSDVRPARRGRPLLSETFRSVRLWVTPLLGPGLLGFMLLLDGGLQAAAAADATPSDSLARARELVETRRFDQAEPLIRRQWARLEGTPDTASVAAAELLDLLVESLYGSRGGARGEALALARRAVALKEALYGPAALKTSRSLFNLGVVHAMSGAPEVAQGVFERVLAIREAELPPGHDETLEAINALGNVARYRGDPAAAVAVYERGLEQVRLSEAPPSSAIWVLRGNLGSCLSTLGRFDEAREILEQQVAHYDSTSSPNLSGALNDLANIETMTGDYVRAAQLYRRALDLEEERAGPLTPWALQMRGNAAVAHVRLGQFDAARQLLERQAALLAPEGQQGAELGLTLSRIAHIAAELGDHQEELELRRRALELLEAARPAGHPQIGRALFNLGTAYGNLGDFDQQERFVERARAAWMANQGEQHEFLADCHLALATVARSRAAWADAREQAHEALRIERAWSGEASPKTAAVLATLGEIAWAEGELDTARTYLAAARTILADRLGGDHPLAAQEAIKLAAVEHQAGHRVAARTLAFAAEGAMTPHLRLTLRALPERQALLYVEERAGAIDLLLDLLGTEADADLTARVWDAVIRTRALVFDELAARTRRLRAAALDSSGGSRADAGAEELEAGADATPRIRSAALHTYQNAATRLANMIVSGPGETELAIYRRLIADARRKLEAAERELAASGGGASDAGRREGDGLGRAAGLGDVARALPARTALVAYVRYDPPASWRDQDDGARYRAFVLPRAAATPVSIEIGAAAGIDALITDWSAAVAREDHAAAAAELESGAILRRIVWDPVAPHLEGVERVLIVPDGGLHLLNPMALPAAQGGYLLESELTVHQLTAEREIVACRDRTPGASTAALVIGAPDFDALPLKGAADGTASIRVSDLARVDHFRGQRTDCAELESLRFAPLDASRREADEVALRWRGGQTQAQGRATLLIGREATEEAFKRLAPGRRLLHLATHGFLLDRTCFAGPANPLLFSGLALAGANRRSQATADRDDGLLTAQEIAALDLSGTQWAVLSACDSRGRDVLAGEGVFGLQRAFRIAGAGTVIASLWPVRDETAREWMESFYRASLDEELDTAAAVRWASLALLRELRDRGESTRASRWGAFVASGDWR